MLADRKGGRTLSLDSDPHRRRAWKAANFSNRARPTISPPPGPRAIWSRRGVGHGVGRGAVAMALNPRHARTQDQFHIHIECVRMDVAKALGESGARGRRRLVAHHRRRTALSGIAPHGRGSRRRQSDYAAGGWAARGQSCHGRLHLGRGRHGLQGKGLDSWCWPPRARPGNCCWIRLVPWRRTSSVPADEPQWLKIARELRAIAQTGLAFTTDGFDRLRYERVRELAALMLAQGSGEQFDVIIEILREGWGYTTPRSTFAAPPSADGHVLLVREIGDGKWTLPGGWADVNQSARRMRGARDRRRIGIRGPGAEAGGGPRLPAQRSSAPQCRYDLQDILHLRNHRRRRTSEQRDPAKSPSSRAAPCRPCPWGAPPRPRSTGCSIMRSIPESAADFD